MFNLIHICFNDEEGAWRAAGVKAHVFIVNPLGRHEVYMSSIRAFS